ncbi:hypothetical protein Tco_1262651 [Tanacetum coccineum]
MEAEKDEEILHLKATPPTFASFFQGLFQALVWKFLALDEFNRVQAELLSLAASAEFEHGLTSSLIAQTDHDFLNKIFEHVAEPLYVILQLEPKKLARSNNVPTSRNAHVSPPFTKESTMTPAFASLELPSDTAPTSSIAALEPNEEWVNAMVDGPDYDMIGDADKDKPKKIFVQRVSHAVDADGDLVVDGSGRVFFDPYDVVVALSVGGKNNYSISSSGVDKVAAPPYRLRSCPAVLDL